MYDCLFSLIHPDAQPPFQKHSSDVGWDVFACETVEFGPYECKFVDTGLVIVPPKGYYFDALLRSSMGDRFQLTNSVGVIDPDYRNSVKLRLLNFSGHNQKIEKGNKIAQLILRKRRKLNWILVNYDTIKDTERGTGGFGSTGK